VRFFRGHQAAATVMLARAKEAAQRAPAPAQRMVDVTVAWTRLAAGSGDAALRGIDELEKSAKAHGDDAGFAWAAVERGEMLVELGKRDEARAQFAEALRRSEKMSAENANTLRRVTFWAAQRNALASGRKDEAAKAVKGLEALPATSAESTAMREMLTAALAAQAIGTGNSTQAVALLSNCSRTNFRCQQEMVEALTLAGNQKAADETRAWMATANVRDGLSQGEDPIYLYLRMRFSLPARAGNP
jgi:hypothetical protein